MKVKYRLVTYYWLDAQSSTDWKNIDDIEDQTLALCLSTGYLVHETDKSVTLVSDFASGNHEDIDSVGNLIVIPRACIIKEVDHI